MLYKKATQKYTRSIVIMRSCLTSTTAKEKYKEKEQLVRVILVSQGDFVDDPRMFEEFSSRRSRVVIEVERLLKEVFSFGGDIRGDRGLGTHPNLQRMSASSVFHN